MRERPIRFNGDMVRAILDGRKTQTRRPVKSWESRQMGDDEPTGHQFAAAGVEHTATGNPFGAAGDRLWCRETWQTVNSCQGPGIAYRADRDFVQPEFDGPDEGYGPTYNYEKYPGEYLDWYDDLISGAEGRWRPSIHMPRWASRITLEVVRVWVERVQDITTPDAVAEGIELLDGGDGNNYVWRDYSAAPEDDEGYDYHHIARDSFASLWGSIYDQQQGLSWHDNPWVWCCEFRRVEQ